VAGYSGTPLPRKLGIGEGTVVALRGAPEGFERTLGALPDGARLKARVSPPVDVVLAFFKRATELDRRLDGLAGAIFPDGGLWVAWPKRASGVPTDITEDVVRELALPRGLVDNKVCAIDDTWSGLRVVHRVENRSR
jgi:hypothetical protein